MGNGCMGPKKQTSDKNSADNDDNGDAGNHNLKQPSKLRGAAVSMTSVEANQMHNINVSNVDRMADSKKSSQASSAHAPFAADR